MHGSSGGTPNPLNDSSGGSEPLLLPSPKPPSPPTCYQRCLHRYDRARFTLTLAYTALGVFTTAYWTIQLTRNLAAPSSCVAAGYAEHSLCGWCVAGVAWPGLAVLAVARLGMCRELLACARELGDVSIALAHYEDVTAYSDGSRWRALFLVSVAMDLLFFSLTQVQAIAARPPMNFKTASDVLMSFLAIYLPLTTAANFGQAIGSQLVARCARKEGTTLHKLQRDKRCCSQCRFRCVQRCVAEPFRLALLGAVAYSLVSSISAKVCTPE